MAVIISRRSSYCPNFATAPEKMPHFRSEIPLREDMHLAFGYRPGPDMHGYDQVADELMEMMK